MTFTPPTTSSGDYVKIADLNGHLCIFTPTEFIQSITTAMGETEAIKVNIIDLDTNEEHIDVLVFNKAILSSLKPNVGAQVLARVGQGIAKPGKSAPWILNDATTDAGAVAKATAYLSAQANGTAPATPAESASALSTVVDINDPAIQAALAKLATK